MQTGREQRCEEDRLLTDKDDEDANNECRDSQCEQRGAQCLPGLVAVLLTQQRNGGRHSAQEYQADILDLQVQLSHDQGTDDKCGGDLPCREVLIRPWLIAIPFTQNLHRQCHAAQGYEPYNLELTHARSQSSV